MRRSERNWCLAYAFVLAVLTTLPYLLAYASEGEAWRFSGFLFGVEDGNSYIAKMLQGANGAWLFRTPYTAQDQTGVVAFLPYLLLGKLASGEAMHEQLVALYHLFRIVSIPLAVWATYRFIARFVDEIQWRRWATLLATAGGGLGWLLLLATEGSLLGSGPLEFYSPETFGFLSIYGIPHLVLARALLLFGLTAYLDAAGKASKSWKAGGFLAFLALVQPLTVLVGYAVIGAHLIAVASSARKGELRATLAPWLKVIGRILLVSGPLVVYFAFSFLFDPFLRTWTDQNLILSPHPVHYLLAYGALLPLAFLGGRKLLRTGSVNVLLPITWVVLIPALAYAPHNLQRRLPEGAWVALVALSAAGLAAWKASPLGRRILAGSLLGLSLVSAIVLVGGGGMLALAPRQPVFLPVDQVRAFQRLGERAEFGEVVLASYATSNALPAWAPLRVVAGHGPESADLETIQPRVNGFYDERTPDSERLTLLDLFVVRYVIWGPEERNLGAWQPSEAGFLREWIDTEAYRIFVVDAD